MTPDFEYRIDGWHYKLFPNTKQAETIWREINDVFPDCAIPCMAWQSVRSDLKRAGYTVRRVPKPKPMTPAELDALLADLT